MNKMELICMPTDDKQQVCLEMRMNDKPLGHVILEPADAEALAHNIAQQRSKLSDQVSSELDPGSRLTTVMHPLWHAAASKSDEVDYSMLNLRHPGLGWLSFAFNDKEATAIGRFFLKHAQQEE